MDTRPEAIGSYEPSPSMIEPCMIVAEVAQGHDGSLGTAHAYIDAAARAGADAVKFQTHIAAAESTPSEPWRVRFSLQDPSRYDYWKRMEFTEEQWRGLRDHAVEMGVQFVSSPFSVAAVELLDRIEVDIFKVASGEVSNRSMLERIVETRRPVVLSSGMSAFAELDDAVAIARRGGSEPTVLQCTTAYPCPPERLGLNVLAELRARYGLPVGFSDHSGTIFAGLAAATLGISMLEIHVTFSRDSFGPDVVASITFDELRSLVEGIRFIEAALAHPVVKDELSDELAPLKALFAHSIVAARDLPVGHTITPQDLAFKKPGSGVSPDRAPELLGRRLSRAVKMDTLLSEDDLESCS